MSKTDDINDLLGETKPAKKTAPAKKAAAPAAPAKKAAAPAKKAAEAKTEKAPVRFAEGERQAMYDAITAHFKRSKKAINSKDLAAKLAEQLPKMDITTRKLRPVLYAMAKKAEPMISLELSSSKVQGMTVSPA